MTGLRAVLCGLALVLASCAVAGDEPSPVPADDATSSTAADLAARPEIMIPRALSLTPREENCTETFGACKVGQCELGPRDHFQRITEVCCDANGQNCTTELYRLCGC
jgi:hypothetical protein